MTEHEATKDDLFRQTTHFFQPMSVKGLVTVPRWQDFQHIPIERQTVAEHVLSLAKLIRFCAKKVNKNRTKSNWLDISLLTDAALVHDDGEGILAVDISARLKQDYNVVHEFLAVSASLNKTDPEEHLQTLRSYLLQYCFAEEIKDLLRLENGNTINIIKSLEKEKPDEAFFFKLIERLEYILFGLRQYFQRSILEVALSTIDHHGPSLNLLCKNNPDFELIWTPELSSSCKKLSRENPNIPRK